MGIYHADPECVPREQELYASKIVCSIGKSSGDEWFTTILRALCTLREGADYGENCLCDGRGRLLSLPSCMQRFETNRLYDKTFGYRE